MSHQDCSGIWKGKLVLIQTQLCFGASKDISNLYISNGYHLTTENNDTLIRKFPNVSPFLFLFSGKYFDEETLHPKYPQV